MGLRKWFWRWFSARWISKIEAKADREEAVAKAVTQYRNQVESVLRMECDGLRRRVAVLERRPEPADLVSHLERVLKGHGLVACQLEAAIGKVRGLHGPSEKEPSELRMHQITDMWRIGDDDNTIQFIRRDGHGPNSCLIRFVGRRRNSLSGDVQGEIPVPPRMSRALVDFLERLHGVTPQPTGKASTSTPGPKRKVDASGSEYAEMDGVPITEAGDAGDRVIMDTIAAEHEARMLSKIANRPP